VESQNISIQTTVSSWLLDIEGPLSQLWDRTGLVLMILLIALTLTNFYSVQAGKKYHRNGFLSFLFSPPFFCFLLGIFIFLMRLPGLSRLELNPDESQAIAAAITLLIDPRYWISIDGGTSGPLVPFSLTIFPLFGVAIDYGSTKLLAVIIWIVSVLLMYRAFANFFQDHLARVLILPLASCVAIFTWWDYVAYNTEHVPILLLALALFLTSKAYLSNDKQQAKILFFSALALGLVLFAKLQVAPIVFVLGIYLIIVFGYKNPKNIKYLIGGALLPILLVLLYLWLNDLFYDFWSSYIQRNLVYAERGLGGMCGLLLLENYLSFQISCSMCMTLNTCSLGKRQLFY